MAAPTLSGLGSLSYGGFDFSGPTTETLKASIKPQYDAAGRTVIYTVYSFTFRTLIAGDPTDSQIQFARRVLTKPGGQFVYRNRGLGDISVNCGGAKDVLWGPKPQEVSFEPTSDQACWLTWSVEVAVPECSNARFALQPMEFNFEVSFDIDKSGYTTRTYSGFVRVPMTRKTPTDRTLPDSADSYREKITPRRTKGFRRVSSSFKINTDKTRLDFTIVDEQMGRNAPPPGIVTAEADYHADTSGEGFTTWFATLNATYEMAAGVPNNTAANAFIKLFDYYASKSVFEVFGAAAGGGCIMLHFSVREPSIYGKPVASFSATWRFTTSLDAILSRSGFWTRVPDSDWQKWDATMGKVLGPRGVSGLQFTASEDKIVDLCMPAGGKTAPDPPREPDTVDIKQGRMPGPKFSRPAPGFSWLDYQCWIETEGDQGIATLRTLPASASQVELRSSNTPDIFSRSGSLPASTSSSSSGGGGGGSASQGLFGIAPAGMGRLDNQQPPKPTGNAFPGLVGSAVVGRLSADMPPEVKVQQRTAPLLVVYLCGHALRAGYPVPMPELTLLNGETPVAANRLDRGEGFFGPRIVANWGTPIYAARWRLRYLLQNIPPGGIPTPPNPLFGGG